MKFTFHKRRRKFSDYLRPRKKVVVTYRRTIGKLLGFGGGYVSNIRSDERLARDGDAKHVVKILAREARKQGLDVPFGIPFYALDDYDLTVSGWKPEVAMLNESSRRAGSRRQQSQSSNSFPFELPCLEPQVDFTDLIKGMELAREFEERKKKYKGELYLMQLDWLKKRGFLEKYIK